MNMKSNAQKPQPDRQDDSKSATRKPYKKPSFQHERVFETMALSCGKMAGTGGACMFNRKIS
ncbi:MAG TPA: hypothetical protein VIY66_11265 [Candidatus Acidoferrales bacterium]